MKRSYKQKLQRLYERLDDALLAETAEAFQNLHIIELYDQSAAVVPPGKYADRLQSADECGSERTASVFYSAHVHARVATKFQDNTIVVLGGQASYGTTHSQELADEMEDSWGSIMLRYFTSPTSIAFFLAQASPPIGLDDLAVTMAIFTEDIRVA